MRIIHTADWHLGKTLEGRSRLDEQEAFLGFFAAQCQDLKPDLILIAGDIYDSANPPTKAEQLLYNSLKKLSRGGECIILIIAGNHDSPERLVTASPLAKEHGIIMVGTPKTVVEPGSYGKYELIDAKEGFIELEIKGERLAIVCVPYPSEKTLREAFYVESDEEAQRALTYQDRMNRLFRELETNFREDTINITVSHLFALGSEPGYSERAMSLGASYLVPTDILPGPAHYTALGHIHKPQILPNTGVSVRYSGSPLAYRVSESVYQKKFYVIDIDEDKKVEISDVDIPVFKPIDVWELDSIEEAIQTCEDNKDRDSWVYMKVKTDRPIRDDELKKMKSLKADIIEIKASMEEEGYETDAESITDLSFEEQFIEFYKYKKGREPQKELIDLLRTLCEEVEDEAY